MIDFGLCLAREFTFIDTSLMLNVCDNRTEATFLCEHDDLDFALKTFLNRDFIEMTNCWIIFPSFPDHSSCETDISEKLLGKWTEEIAKIIHNRRPRRIMLVYY